MTTGKLLRSLWDLEVTGKLLRSELTEKLLRSSSAAELTDNYCAFPRQLYCERSGTAHMKAANMSGARGG